MFTRFCYLFLFTLLLLSMTAVFAQEPPPEIDAAITDLSERLGEELTLESFANWTWAEEVYGDASMGCPKEGQMYAQVVTRAYHFTFTYEGIVYDYRVAQDGDAVILCESYPVEETADTDEPLFAPGAITIDNAASVQELVQLNTQQGIIAVMTWLPNGTIAVAGSAEDGGVWLYASLEPDAEPNHIATGDPVTALASGQSDSVVLLAAALLNGDIQLLQVEPQGSDAVVMTGVEQAATGLAISPDGSLVASATGSATGGEGSANAAYLWSAQTGELLATLEHDAPVNSVAFNPDGALLASGDENGDVHLWNVSASGDSASAEEMIVLPGHTDVIRDLAFRADGRVLASGSMDGAARLWNVSDPARAGELLTLDAETDDAVIAVAFSPNGEILATAGGNPNADGDNAVRLWDVSVIPTMPETPQTVTLATLEGHSATVGSVAFSPDGALLASTGDDGTLRLWGIPASRG